MRTSAIKRIHFGLLLILILNYLIALQSDYGLDFRIQIAFKVLVFISGCILFILPMIKLKTFKYYYSLYIITPVLALLFWLIDGLMGAIIFSLLLFIINPSETLLENKDYKLRSTFNGLLGPCCSYSIFQNRFFLFEKKSGDFQFGLPPSDLRDLKISESKKVALITFIKDDIIKTDSTFVIKLK